MSDRISNIARRAFQTGRHRLRADLPLRLLSQAQADGRAKTAAGFAGSGPTCARSARGDH